MTASATTSGTDEHALTIDSVTKTFGTDSAAVLEEVALAVRHGEFVAIVGPSGCGKTTLLRIIQGLETATAGRVSTAGHGAGGRPRMSYVFQRASLLPWYTVRQNVSFGVTLTAGRDIYPSKREREIAVDELLELTGLRRYAGYLPSQISGGMQQRANVARALAVRPDVLLLDEPFSALDALTREKLQIDVARILSSLGTTAILVTHDIREAVFLSDRVAIMSAHPGRIREFVEIGEPRPRTAEFQHSTPLADLERDIWHRLHG